MSLFADRFEAGKKLSEKIKKYKDNDDIMILALPRGGVPVALEMSRNLNLPMDIYMVRKLGVPGHEEYAFGALAENGALELDKGLLQSYRISDDEVHSIIAREKKVLEKRNEFYRGSFSDMPSFEGKHLILVDDGLATGASMKVAVKSLREENPARIIVAVPVAAQESLDAVGRVADETFVVHTPTAFFSVGTWYDDFTQVSDDDVKEYLDEVRRGVGTR